MVKGEIINTRHGLGQITKIKGGEYYYVRLFESDLIWLFEKSELSDIDPLLKELY